MPQNKNVSNQLLNANIENKQQDPEINPELVYGEPYKSNYILPEEITETTSIADVARSIIEHPNLWGLYSIADAFNGLVEFEVKKRIDKITK